MPFASSPFLRLHNPHELVKERLELRSDARLLRGTSAAKAAHEWEDSVEGGARGFTANNLLHHKTRMLSKSPKILLIDLITIDWMEPYIILR